MQQTNDVLFTMPGSPCIFYGTEVLLEGAHDPDCRRCMPWKEIEEGKYDEHLAFVKNLTRLRKEEPLFRSRNFHFTNAIDNERVLEYIKIDDYDSEKMGIIMNCDQKPVKVEVNGMEMMSHLYTDETLEPGGIVIWKIKNKD